MFSKKHFINNFSSALILFVNFLFILKFSSLLQFNGTLFAVIFLLFTFTGLLIINSKFKENDLTFNKLYVLVFGGLNQAIIIVLAISNNSQLLDVIFYSIGFLLLYSFVFYSSKTKKVFYTKLFLSLFLPVGYLEFFLLNNYLFISTFFAAGIFLSVQSFLDEDFNLNFFFLSGLITVLIIINPIFIFIYPLYLLYFFRMNFKKGIIFLSSSVLIGVIIIFFLENSKKEFTNQFFFLSAPLLLVIIIFAVSIYVGWILADLNELFFTCGLFLFFISFYFSFKSNYFQNISALSACIPFFIFALKEYKVDYYLGKIYTFDE